MFAGQFLRPERTSDTEAHAVETAIAPVSPTAGGDNVRGIADVRPAAYGMLRAVAAGDPYRAVSRRISVIIVPTVLRPLPDAADHIVEAECIRRERADRRRRLVVPSRAATVAVRIALTNIVAPWIGRGGARARGIFVFGLAE